MSPNPKPEHRLSRCRAPRLLVVIGHSALRWLGHIISTPGEHVTSVKVDVPRLLGKPAHSASCSRVWEKPHAHFSLEPPFASLILQRPACTVGRHPGTRERALHTCAQAGATWARERGFQGASGQAPCVLMTVSLIQTQRRAPPRQRSCLINTLTSGDYMRSPSKPKRKGWRREWRGTVGGPGLPNPPLNTKKSSSAQETEAPFLCVCSCLAEAGTYPSLRISPKGSSSRRPEPTCLPEPGSDLDVPPSVQLSSQHGCLGLLTVMHCPPPPTTMSYFALATTQVLIKKGMNSPSLPHFPRFPYTF